MEDELSKVVVYESGDVLNVETVRELIIDFWNMNECEKKSFLRTVAKYPSFEDFKQS